MIFVFGSNLAGVHGAGAAKHAWNHEGAEWYKGVGHYGNSYAIPTKDRNICTLPLENIQDYVEHFIGYAMTNIDLQFKVTRIGCGLAGYSNQDIAPMFVNAPSNCYFDKEWRIFMLNANFWE